MNFPKISIVIPSYNQGQFLEETILSVINQEYPNLELFVVDGGSNDNSVDIIRKYESQITWWVSENDNGQSDAINKGFARATGEIITWLCSDDLYTPGALSKAAECFSRQGENVGLIYGGVIIFQDSNDQRINWGYKDKSIERYLAGMAFSQPSAFYRKKYLNKIGGKVNEQLHYGMDFNLFSELALICDFVSVNEVFAKYRFHSQSKSVAEVHKFITDWTKTFVNLCANLGWDSITEKMKSTEVIDNSVFSWRYKFNFIPNPKIVEKIDTEKLLFIHLCYILKDLYWNDRRSQARHLLTWLKKNYSVTRLKNEEGVGPIMKKLSLPDALLTLLKKISRMRK